MNDGRPTRWHDLKTMLATWMAWLDESQQWAETTVAAGRSEDRAQTVPPADASVVGTTSDVPHGLHADTSRPDLFALLASMAALRQDVNLQTRSARRDREQATQTLEQLSGAVMQLEREWQAADERRMAHETDYVHVDTLLDLHDALSRAERQASSLITSTVATLHNWSAWQERHEHQEMDGQTDAVSPENDLTIPKTQAGAFGRLRRWFAGSALPSVETPVPPVTQTHVASCNEPDHAHVLRQISDEAVRMAERLEGLVTGYRLSLQRLERLLATCGIEPISCLEESVDPELMEVVQIVSDTRQPQGTVTDEVRRGYRRHGQVYRFAQVVATRSDSPERGESVHDTAPVDEVTEEASGSCS